MYLPIVNIQCNLRNMKRIQLNESDFPTLVLVILVIILTWHCKLCTHLGIYNFDSDLKSHGILNFEVYIFL